MQVRQKTDRRPGTANIRRAEVATPFVAVTVASLNRVSWIASLS